MIITFDLIIGIILGILISGIIFMGVIVKGDLYAIYNKTGSLSRVECKMDQSIDSKKFVVFTIIKIKE